jgi:cytochrome c-type biogenesis protein
VTGLLASSGVPSTTVFAAFGAGFLSFVSPCVLPLVPGYLSAISGVSFADIKEGRSKRHILVPALIFCISFSFMFILLGMTATGVGQSLQDNRVLLREISGVLIITMGVFFIATLFVPFLNREWRPEQLMKRAGTGGPVIAGLAFAIAWLPCTGATLGAVLSAASSTADVGKGAVLLSFYSAGMAVPFLLSALAFTSVTGFFRFFRDHYHAITIASGVILIAFGVLLYTNQTTRLNSEAQNLLSSLGLDFFTNV